MNLTEILQARGIQSETTDGILADMKKNSLFTAGEENLDIRYGKLKEQHEGTEKQLTEANALIEQLKADPQSAEGLTAKVAQYEAKVAAMESEMEKTKLEAAIKVALLSAKAADADYLAYKLRQKAQKDGTPLTLDENGDIKGWKDLLEGLKTQFPGQFGKGKEGEKEFKPNPLPKGEEETQAPSQAQFRQMGYEARLKLKQEHPDIYQQFLK